ncbi:MAG TPA: hypothetical protein DCG51_05790 [Erysipelotrichaceae bacterium]|nr:hypothetical protein [Erysipelotrichaceae bacterium]
MEEIVASFSLVKGVRVLNGPIEGRNSLIKKVLKLANGYSNFNRFRNRIIGLPGKQTLQRAKILLD